MKTFAQIQSLAEDRKGGKSALQKLLPSVLSNQNLGQLGDDRFLAMMTRAVNQAGFRWSVVEKKWPEFEEAFFGFNIDKLSLLSLEQWEAYAQDTRIIRHWQKIKSVMDNLSFIRQEAAVHGSFAQFMAAWPADDQIGLMSHLKKHGARLGGQTGQWFMRYVGKDCFVLTNDVVASLQRAGLDIADNPTSKRDLLKIQTLMNDWQQQSGLPYAHVSKVVACSIGHNDGVESST